MILAPIVIFVYNRIWHTKQTISALKENILAKDSHLIIYSDAAKSKDDIDKVNEVRQYLNEITGFCSKEIIFQESNLGLAKSIISGVTDTVNKYGKIIVLEDDLITSPYFLTFMNEALDFYKDENKVVSIHGYMYPVLEDLPETFFLRGAQCWGWATWKRGWDLFDADAKSLINQIQKKKLRYLFDRKGTYPFFKMLKEQAMGEIDSWAIRWQASAFLNDKLTLYPRDSLVKNIGFDGSGVHCGPEQSVFNVEVSSHKVNVENEVIEQSAKAHSVIENYYNNLNNGSKIKRKLKDIIRNVFNIDM
ncbi:MAG: glycosyl transferase [Thalassobius sp.]|nr:glycosyl transferase [Thalassovita sp.]